MQLDLKTPLQLLSYLPKHQAWNILHLFVSFDHSFWKQPKKRRLQIVDNEMKGILTGPWLNEPTNPPPMGLTDHKNLTRNHWTYPMILGIFGWGFTSLVRNLFVAAMRCFCPPQSGTQINAVTQVLLQN